DGVVGQLALGRHARLFLVANGLDEPALFRVTRHEDRPRIAALEEAFPRRQAEAALLLAVAVAGVAPPAPHRPDLLLEEIGVGGAERGGAEEGGNGNQERGGFHRRSAGGPGGFGSAGLSSTRVSMKLPRPPGLRKHNPGTSFSFSSHPCLINRYLSFSLSPAGCCGRTPRNETSQRSRPSSPVPFVREGDRRRTCAPGEVS